MSWSGLPLKSPDGSGSVCREADLRSKEVVDFLNLSISGRLPSERHFLTPYFLLPWWTAVFGVYSVGKWRSPTCFLWPAEVQKD